MSSSSSSSRSSSSSGPSIQIRLYDANGNYIPFAAYQATIGRSTLPAGKADQDGYIVVSAQGPQICVVQWGARGTQAPYPFSLGVFLNIVEDDMERASYQRLSNLGYRMQPPPSSVAAFQDDYGQTYGMTITGKLDSNTMKAIKTVHDACFHRLAT